jgi:hypothetical protein
MITRQAICINIPNPYCIWIGTLNKNVMDITKRKRLTEEEFFHLDTLIQNRISGLQTAKKSLSSVDSKGKSLKKNNDKVLEYENEIQVLKGIYRKIHIEIPVFPKSTQIKFPLSGLEGVACLDANNKHNYMLCSAILLNKNNALMFNVDGFGKTLITKKYRGEAGYHTIDMDCEFFGNKFNLPFRLIEAETEDCIVSLGRECFIGALIDPNNKEKYLL